MSSACVHPVRPRVSGDHTPCPRDVARRACYRMILRAQWLWVPAFAGTTLERSCRTPSDALTLPPLHLAHRRFGRDAAAAALEGVSAVRFPLALDGAARECLPVIGPVAERVAVPRRLRSDCGQFQLLPDAAGALHELARWQRERRGRSLQ